MSTLKAVVFPAPLGPISPLRSPWRISRSKSVSALQAAELDADAFAAWSSDLAAHASPFRARGTQRGSTSQISRVPNSPCGRDSMRTTSRMP